MLKELGARLRFLLSSSHTSARIGGEEFAVLMPNCTYTKGLHLAEEIRHTIDANPILLTSGDTIPVTVSLGIAHYPTNTPDPQTLPLIADRMLYKAKTSGRNQVCSTEKKNDRPKRKSFFLFSEKAAPQENGNQAALIFFFNQRRGII